MNIMNDLQIVGINPFAVTLLAESVLKSPLAPTTVGNPQRISFPIKRSDCAGWAGVRITVEAVPEADRDAPWPPTRTSSEVEALLSDALHVAEVLQSKLGATRNHSGLNADEQALWDRCHRLMYATGKSASSLPVEPMDWPIPCDFTVGHVTMRKGVKLRTLAARMKVLYEMATGANAEEVEARTPEQRAALAAKFFSQDTP